jgi:DNA (cytosine-5)-methyltransferase 1
MRALHLFAGGGGSVLAGHLLGWTSVGAVEIEPAFRRMLRARGERLVGCDVAKFDGRKHAGTVDVVVGGSPCQDLSVAGKRAGLDGKRSGLWYEQLRIFNECEAPYLWWENVAGALTSNGGRDFAAILASLDESGCDAVWTSNTASSVGAPHKRERIWLLAWRRGVAHADVDRELQPQGSQRDVGGRAEHVSEPRHVAHALRERGRGGDAAWGHAEDVGERPGGAGDGPGAVAAERAFTDVGGAPHGLANGMDWPAARGAWPHGRGPAQAAWESPRTCPPGHPQRKQRLMALGNGWVPHQAVAAWRALEVARDGA